MGYIIADRIEIPRDCWHKFAQPISDFRTEEGWILDAGFAEKYPEMTADIITTKIAEGTTDEMVWTENKYGSITSRAAYTFCRHKFPEVNWGTWIWDKIIPPARSTLFWRFIWAKVPTWDVMRSHGFELGTLKMCFLWQ